MPENVALPGDAAVIPKQPTAMELKLENAFNNVISAADLQDFNGQPWMQGSRLTDPEKLIVFAPLVSEWARLYTEVAWNYNNAVPNLQHESASGSPCFEALRYQHFHDETL